LLNLLKHHHENIIAEVVAVKHVDVVAAFGNYEVIHFLEGLVGRGCLLLEFLEEDGTFFGPGDFLDLLLGDFAEWDDEWVLDQLLFGKWVIGVGQSRYFAAYVLRAYQFIVHQ